MHGNLLDEGRMVTDWELLKTQEAAEAKVPTTLFVLCKAVTENDQGGIFLNGTLVQRFVWAGTPPPTAEGDKPYFQISLKGPLAGGELKERRIGEEVNSQAPTTVEAKKAMGASESTTTTTINATINLVGAPIELEPYTSMFPFRIFTGKVELELQAKNVRHGTSGNILLCPDLCIYKGIETNVGKIVKAKKDTSRSRTLALLQNMPKIQICEDQRKGKGKEGCKYNDKGDIFATHPQITLTFWLHEPASKAAFKIFGPLFLVLALMLFNFEEAYGFDNISQCFDEGKSEFHHVYLTNVITVAIAAVFVVPSIRSTSLTSTRGSFTVDDIAALVFVVGLVLSAWPACGVALVGCLLSCLVVGGAVVSLAVYTFERRKIVNNPINKSVEVKTYEGTPKDSHFDIERWERSDQRRARLEEIARNGAPGGPGV